MTDRISNRFAALARRAVLRGLLAVLLLACAPSVARGEPVRVVVEPIELGVARVHIDARPGDGPARVRFSDALGTFEGVIRVLPAFGRAGVPGLELAWRATPGEILTGLGQRFDAFDHHGNRVDMWIEDAPLQEDGKTYACVPILYSSAGYALCAADNPEGVFDLNSADDGVHRYQRAGLELTLHVVLRETLEDQVRALIPRIGLPAGVPDWAWGPWISKNSYENQGEAEDALRGHFERDIPVSVIVQEAWKGPSGQGLFNAWAFPGWDDIPGFLEMCEARGVKNVLWQVPVLHPSSPHFAEAHANGWIVRKPDGTPSLREAWLAGFGNLDFTNPDAVRWWQDQMRPLVRMGAVGFKADDGEDIKPDDVFHDGRRGWEMHNEYTMLYAKALAELMEQEGVDGMIWARSASLGQQAYPALWAGDQYATWEQMATLIPAGLSSGLSGMPFWSHDIGGYAGTCDPELYIRWAQFGALSPFMQYHGIEAREPWLFGDEALEAYTFLARARMNLIPHFKKLAAEATATGLPIMRPMSMVFPDDDRFAREATQYMLGEDLLVAPVLEPGKPGRAVLFPEGSWRHVTQGVVYRGGRTVNAPIGMADLPLFARVGSTISVQLAEDAPLGDWHAEMPERELTVALDRGDIYQLTAPLIASAGDPTLRITFTPERYDEMLGWWRWFDEPDAWRDARVGNPLANGYFFVDIETPDDERRSGRRLVYEIAVGGERKLTGEVWFRPMLDIDTETIHPTVGAGIDDLTLTLTDVFQDHGYAEATLLSPALEIAEPTQWFLPDEGVSGRFTWQVSRRENAVGLLPVRIEFTQDDKPAGGYDLEVHGAVRWAVAGPFNAPHNTSSFAYPYGPAYDQSPDVAFDGAGVRWNAVDPAKLDHAGDLDLSNLIGPGDVLAGYAMTRVRSDRERDVELRFGSDDTLIVWLNGERVHAAETYRAAAPDQELVPVRLRAGVNTIVAQVTQDRNAWQMRFRITAPGGAPVAGLSDGFDDFDAFDPARPPAERFLRAAPLAWSILGPFPFDRAPTLQAPGLQSDAEALANAAAWRPLDADPHGLAGIDLSALTDRGGNQAVYLRAVLALARPRQLTLRAGADDGLVAWLDGRVILNAERPQGLTAEAFAAPLDLPAGRHELVFRVSQGGGDWAFQASIYDRATGLPVQLDWR
ncbi:MAG: TIM-barrel domain-containing protein [Planctomycetota bacterium]